MKNITKLFLVALMITFIPMKHFGQTLRDYENGFLFNVFEIENVEERVQLASALAISDIWICNPTGNPGELYIRPNNDHADIPMYAEFDYLRMTLKEEYEEAILLPKEEFAEVFNSWAYNISNDYYNFLISDHLDRANHCMDAEPFCTSDVYNFPALNSGYSWSGPDYGCLNSSPTNKHSFWYYMRIGVAGNITIKIEASFDVDFALWGPFNNQIEPCPTQAGETGMLTAACDYCPNNTSSSANYPYGNLHDCSFDPADYEYAHVVNGQVGQYFILLITNYSGNDGSITFRKYSGDGETDCGIMPGIATNGGPYCPGETINLYVNSQAGATYSWTGPNGFTSNVQNPIISNCTYEMGGIYTCVTTVDGQSTTGSTDVIIFPEPVADFEAPAVCFGETTHFTSTSTTNPTGHDITGYHWDFGDGEESEERDPTHTYAAAGTYQVTHTVTTGRRCNDDVTYDVKVLDMPVPTATVNPSSVQYGGVATLTADPGVPGSFTYHWEPANMVTNPNSQTTQTVPIQVTTVFTVTITNTEGDCTDQTQVTVVMAGSDLTATATADQYEICENESTTLHANPMAGTGNYTFSWSPSNTLSSATSQNPVATPPLGSNTYTCTVNDGLTIQIVDVTIIVHPNKEIDNDAEICEGDTYNFYGQSLSTAGVYNHTLQTQYGCDSVVHLHLAINPVQQSEFTITSDEACDSYEWAGESYTTSGDYQRTFSNIHGCDSTVTMHLHLEYTPDPVDIYPTDPDNEYPHWVVTATEFQINSYDFGIFEQTHPFTCRWDSIAWSFENPNIEWLLEPDTTSHPAGKKCKIYVLNFVEDTVWIRATVYNRCAPQGIAQRYWFICSFYGIEEFGSADMETLDFNVIPNPNNGQMMLSFEKLTGKVDMKVYDMKGNLIDHFNTYSEGGTETLNYNMKDHADGIYFFVATTKEGIVAKKVVIR